jgi:hypothetical protein
MNSEKIVKLAIKTIAKATEMEYEQLKAVSKKVLKMAKTYDLELMARIEEILELQDVSSEEELLEFDVDTLKMFCDVKEIDHSDTEKSIRHNVWKYLEEQFDVDDSDSDGSDSEQESESEPEPEPEPVPVKVSKKKKSVEIVGEAPA